MNMYEELYEISQVICIGTMFVALRTCGRVEPYFRILIVILGMDIAVSAAGSFGSGTVGGPLLISAPLVGTVASLLVILGYRMPARRFRDEWLQRCANDPIELAPPFRGTWWVASGGPDRAHNHHMIVQDQYFAYDFLRKGQSSWGSVIVSPCDGEIAEIVDDRTDAAPNSSSRDTEPAAGNYVSIQMAGGYILLCHLKRGSIRVRKGEQVRIGEVIGECGNSGNSTKSHLHVHAQDRADFCPGMAKGLPVVFRDGTNSVRILEYRDALTG